MKKYQKVIHIIADLGNGGAERQLVELVKLNPNHKLLVLGSASIYRRELEQFNISYSELNIKSSFEALFAFHKIRKIIKSSNAKIIHAWMYNTCLLATLLKTFYNMKLKIVWGIRCSNMQLKYYSWILKFTIYFCKKISFKANYIIYNSYAGLKYHISLGFANKNNKVIYNGIDEKKFHFSFSKKRTKTKKKV